MFATYYDIYDQYGNLVGQAIISNTFIPQANQMYRFEQHKDSGKID